MASLWRSVVQNVRRILVNPPPPMNIEESASIGRERLKWMIAEQRKCVKMEAESSRKAMDATKNTDQQIEVGVKNENTSSENHTTKSIKNELELEKIIDPVQSFQAIQDQIEQLKEPELHERPISMNSNSTFTKDEKAQLKESKNRYQEKEKKQPETIKSSKPEKIGLLLGVGRVYERRFLKNNIRTIEQLGKLTDEECEKLRHSIKPIFKLRTSANIYLNTKDIINKE